jgi:diaminopimelate epimerase
VAHVLSERRQTADDQQVAHVIVVLDGGELEVEVSQDLDIDLTGWAKPVFTGNLADDFLEELNEVQ